MSIFNKIKIKTPGHSSFDLSFDVKMSMKMGKLVPCYLQEVVPGDKFFISQEAMFRMMPMISPIMHKVDIYFHTFFCPNRILWDNWERFITGGETDDGSITPALPTLAGTTITASSLGDYMGLPVANIVDDDRVSALPFAAYQRIYHEFYRDENLQTSQPILMLTDGVQTAGQTNDLLTLQSRAWEHDYFTSALPFAQKGDSIEIPLDLTGLTIVPNPGAILSDPQRYVDHLGNAVNAVGGSVQYPAEDSGHSNKLIMYDGGSFKTDDVMIDLGGTHEIDSSAASTTTTINDLRTAFSLQKWLEKNARAGSRYVESLLAHFGVRSRDQRFQRPEYVGGSKATMAISEVLQTSATATGSATPQANMAGHGISVSGGNGHSHYCEEHGWLMTLISIRPKTAYYQGLPRMFTKIDRTEYYWPDFAALGEQEIINKEVYHDPSNPTANNDIFGYVPRYAEYRYNPSRVAGQMRSSLDFWHLGRKFATRPALNDAFITCLPDKRIFRYRPASHKTELAA